MVFPWFLFLAKLRKIFPLLTITCNTNHNPNPNHEGKTFSEKPKDSLIYSDYFFFSLSDKASINNLINIHYTLSLGDKAPQGIDTWETNTSQFPLATRPLGASTLGKHSLHSFPWRRGPSGHRHLRNTHFIVSLGAEAPRASTLGKHMHQFLCFSCKLRLFLQPRFFSLSNKAPFRHQSPHSFLATRPLEELTLGKHSLHSFPWRRGPLGHRHLGNKHFTVSLDDEAPLGIDTCSATVI